MWTASTSAGGRYGQFGAQAEPGKQLILSAHRVAFILARGPIPEGAFICHTCDVGLCCNPGHLFVGDAQANNLDASRKGRFSVPRKRMRAFKSEVITKYLAGGVTAKELGAEYGISYMTVHRWIRQATGGQNQIATRYARGVHASQRHNQTQEAVA